MAKTKRKSHSTPKVHGRKKTLKKGSRASEENVKEHTGHGRHSKVQPTDEDGEPVTHESHEHEPNAHAHKHKKRGKSLSHKPLKSHSHIHQKLSETDGDNPDPERTISSEPIYEHEFMQTPYEANQGQGSQFNLNGPNSTPRTNPGEPQGGKCVQKFSSCNPCCTCCCSYAVACAIMGIIIAAAYCEKISEAPGVTGFLSGLIVAVVAIYVKFKKDIPKNQNLILAILCFVSAGLMLLTIILIFAIILPPVLFFKKVADATTPLDPTGGLATGLASAGATFIIIIAVLDSLISLYGIFVTIVLGCKILAGNAVKRTNYADLADVEALVRST